MKNTLLAPILSIIIVNWNAGQQLHDCLASITQTSMEGFSLAEVIVIDNASKDDSLSAVDQVSLPLTVIRNDSNRGFAAACNQGAKIAAGNFLLFLNPDMRLFEDSLSTPIAFMARSENAQVGICGIQLVDESGRIARTCTRFPTPTRFFWHALGIDRVFPGLGHLMHNWDHGSTRTVDHVMGAFYLVRKSTFDQVGGFDERYFVYLEDLDFSFSSNQKGWLTYYLSEARAFHVGGGTSRQVKATRLFYSLRSRLLYGFKHFAPWQAWGLFVMAIIAEPICRVLFTLLRGGSQEVRNTRCGLLVCCIRFAEYLTQSTTAPLVTDLLKGE